MTFHRTSNVRTYGQILLTGFPPFGDGPPPVVVPGLRHDTGLQLSVDTDPSHQPSAGGVGFSLCPIHSTNRHKVRRRCAVPRPDTGESFWLRCSPFTRKRLLSASSLVPGQTLTVTSCTVPYRDHPLSFPLFFLRFHSSLFRFVPLWCTGQRKENEAELQAVVRNVLVQKQGLTNTAGRLLLKTRFSDLWSVCPGIAQLVYFSQRMKGEPTSVGGARIPFRSHHNPDTETTQIYASLSATTATFVQPGIATTHTTSDLFGIWIVHDGTTSIL